MKRKIILGAIMCTLFSFSGFSQINLNGKLDRLEEFSHLVIDSVVMPDGIKLMTDIFIPVLQDCLMVTLTQADVPALYLLIPDLFPQVNIEIIRRNTQLFVYDSLNGQPNPNPFQLPFVFTRTPYNKEGNEAGRIMSVMGYAYAMQDMRGRYSSEGVYFPMYSDSWNKNGDHPNVTHVLDKTTKEDIMNANKHEDGYWSVDYIAKKLKRDFDFFGDSTELAFIDTTSPGWDLFCNGSIGMFGASALGNTQYQAAAAHRIDVTQKGLKCLLPVVATLEHFNFTAYQNGVFRDRLVTGWIRGQIFDIEDDLIDFDFDRQDNTHTSADYFDIGDEPRNKFRAANLAIDHFVNVQYDGVSSSYPYTKMRGDMDATASPVDATGEAVTNGHNPNGYTGLQSSLPNRDFSRYTNMEVPAYHLTGWWDIYSDGQIETWRQMVANIGPVNRKLQKLVIGPWAHQTIGSTVSGDVVYKDNVSDVIGFDLAAVDFESLEISKILQSEILSWFRYNLNYNQVANIGLPSVRIPESPYWQQIGDSTEIRIPAQEYRMKFKEFINMLIGAQDLTNLPIEFRNMNTGVVSPSSISIPAFNDPLLPEFAGSPLAFDIDSVDYTQIPNVRFYVIGPLQDPDNVNVGNYWYSSDTFPLVQNMREEIMYMHRDGQLNYSAPTVDEGFSIYVHDPDDPVRTHGGGNMIVELPDGTRNSQGQMDFSLPDNMYANNDKESIRSQIINRGGIVDYEYKVTQDSLCIIGYPKVKLYAKSNPGGLQNGPTDTDFFIRVLDVYPDGRELFVVEGCVNARARDYARAISDLVEDSTDAQTRFSNIEIGQIYEYEFVTMPIGYTFGKGHSIKILISSSNYNRYQVNPNLPITEEDFFRRKPNDAKNYVYVNEQGDSTEMEPRIAVQRIAHSPQYPSQIILPVYDKTYTSIEDNATSEYSLDAMIFPNPSSNKVNIYMNSTSNYQLRLTNAVGMEVYTEVFYDFTTIDVSNYAKGFYFAELTDLKTDQRIVRKISVQ